MSKPDAKVSAASLLIDERYGECQCCKTPRILSSAGYCEPCLMLAFASQDEDSTPKARQAAKTAVLLRATWR